MGPIAPPNELPVAIKIAGGLNPERTIFIDGGVRFNAKWFDITLQCGPSLIEEDDIAFRVILSFYKNYSAYTTNSSISGKWDDFRARRKELIIKGLIDETDNKDISITRQSSLADLLQCSFRKPSQTNKANNYPTKTSTKSETLRRKLSYKLKLKSSHSLKISTETTRLANAVPSNEAPSPKLPDILKMSANSTLPMNLDQNKELKQSDQLKTSAKTLQLMNTDRNHTTSDNLKKTAERTQLRDTDQDKLEPHQKSLDNLKMPPKITQLIDSENVREQSLHQNSSDLENKKNLTIQGPSSVENKRSELIIIYKNNLLESAESKHIDPTCKTDQLKTNQKVNLQETVSNVTIKEIFTDDYSDEELNEIELQPTEPFCIALECLENGYLMFLNGDLFCVYPHHFDYSRVTYIVFNGDVDLEQVEVGGGKGPDRTLLVDLYDEVLWSNHVVVLTDENFSELVLGSEEMWIVDAYTAWCPACKKLQPAWEAAAQTLRGRVNVSACDCDRNEQLLDDLNVKYYPMIFCFPKGKKSLNCYHIYRGHYLEKHIVVWALNELGSGSVNKLKLEDVKKPIPRTLRKKKRGILDRKGYLTGGYGYVLRKLDECSDFHETSSSKYFYKSQSTQTNVVHLQTERVVLSMPQSIMATHLVITITIETIICLNAVQHSTKMYRRMLQMPLKTDHS